MVEAESGVMEGVVLVVVLALPESVREEREWSVTWSSLSTFSADCSGRGMGVVWVGHRKH